MLNLKVVVTDESKKNTKCGVANGRSKHEGVVNVLHVTTGDESGLVFDDFSGAVALDLVLP
jgi:hypothetical protein